MATRTKNKSTIVAFAKELVAGTTKHLGSVTTLTIQGRPQTPAQVEQRLQALIDLRQAVDGAKAATKARLADEKANLPSLRAYLDAYVTFIKATFAGMPDALADFGIQPKARATLTAEAKTVAAAKRKATRAARHVMGPKQRKAVKGAVTGVVVTPVSASQPAATTQKDPAGPATSTGATATAAPAPRAG
ncbi:MAG: hypothetical protein JOZ69_18165 [Myxococcales bacterium]|nr:hypothetical protein [Myxococcales bacterium]